MIKIVSSNLMALTFSKHRKEIVPIMVFSAWLNFIRNGLTSMCCGERLDVQYRVRGSDNVANLKKERSTWISAAAAHHLYKLVCIRGEKFAL